MKKQKEETKSATDKLQECITELQHAHDVLEQYIWSLPMSTCGRYTSCKQ